jgi:dimethylhistidine N-methyltransferase
MATSNPRVTFHDLQPRAASLLEDVIAGLSAAPKRLPPKYFYDARGSRLFEDICELPEYYPTRTELAIMRDHADEVVELLGPDCALIEYGSGSGRKTRVLIGKLHPRVYTPIDISREPLLESADQLAAEFPDLRVIAVCADYSRSFVPPEFDRVAARRRAIYFPGSTIGNFTGGEALEFLRNARHLAGPGGAMVVGVDLEKDPAILHAAYNDARGVTAAFNLNLLQRINRELGADFDLDAFRHRAFYNAAEGRIEMHLASVKDQQVTVAGRVFSFARDETIHTENSYKYSVEAFQLLARRAGFSPAAHWVDERRWFSVHYLEVPAADRMP